MEICKSYVHESSVSKGMKSMQQIYKNQVFNFF